MRKGSGRRAPSNYFAKKIQFGSIRGGRRIETQFFDGREIPLELFLEKAQAALGQGLLAQIDAWQSGNLLAGRVRKPSKVLFGEAQLDPAALERLVERIEALLTTAPELAFTFKVALSAEGKMADGETLEKLNEVLAEVKAGWKLG